MTTYILSNTNPSFYFTGQEVHPFGLAPKEDSRHPQGSDPSRGFPDDPQRDPKVEGFPHEEVRCQGLSFFDRSTCILFLFNLENKI